MTIYDRIRARRLELGLTVEELANKMGYKDKSSISKIENGKADIPQSKVAAFAAALDTTTAYLIGAEPSRNFTPQPKPEPIPAGFSPVPDTVRLPLLGAIACGKPITAIEDIRDYIDVPKMWGADFVLECKGDSMAPRIQDGDIVAIRRQPMVEAGQIAAVLIEDEALLKHVYYDGHKLTLTSENPAYPPLTYGPDTPCINIEGLAVGICRSIQR